MVVASPTLLRLLLGKLPSFTGVVFAMALFAYSVWVAYLQPLALSSATPLTILPPATTTHLSPIFETVELVVSQQELETLYDHWKALEAQQPTHQDVLLNLGVISEALGKTSESREYFRRAQESSPNTVITQ